MNKIINLHKPPGPTSHDMVDVVRHVTGEKTVGHAGTLDPFAEGVLLILVGREATRRQKEFMALPKTYIATLHLGATSDTDDLTGRITNHDIRSMGNTFVTPAKAGVQNLNPGSRIESGMTREKIESILRMFIGDIEQTPPIYSAIKLKGKKAYELARKGIALTLKSRKVHIERITLLHYEWPKLEIEVACGSGTYIRALARDIGQKLRPPSHEASAGQGCGAYVEKLTRTRVGPYTTENAIHPEALTKEDAISFS